MISVLCIVSSHGEMLIKEDYRNDVPQEELSKLISYITKGKPELFTPVIELNGIYGHCIKRDKLLLIAVSKRKLYSVVTLHFLEEFYGLLRNFCGNVTEDCIEQNMILVHELMTECLANGYIQTTSTEQLRSIIYSDPAFTKTGDNRKPGPFGLEKNTVPGSCAERPLVKSRSHQNLKRDEVFVDVVEKLTVHFGKDASVRRFHLKGAIQIKSFISLNHSLHVCLNEDIHLKKDKEAYSSSGSLDDWYFEDCVNSSEFEKSRSFVVRPTQGEVSAMRYQIESTIPHQLPFRLSSVIEESKTSQDCNLTLRLTCAIPSNTKALNLVIHIPVSSATRNVMQQFSMADCVADFIPSERKILWKIKSLPGSSEVIGKFKLIEALQCPANRLEIGPVALEFEVSNFVCSGVIIKNLRAEDPSRKPIPMQKWVRYVTLADSYMFKL